MRIKETNKHTSVQKLKWQFLFFGFFLLLIIGIFTTNAWQQIRNQELQTYQRIAESAFNQLQARISEFLLAEDAKVFADYQFLTKDLNLTEDQIDRGFLGYFQIGPNNKFESQFSKILTVDTKSLGRKNQIQHEKLESLTKNLLEEKPNDKSGGFVQLNTAPQIEFPKDDHDDFTASGSVSPYTADSEEGASKKEGESLQKQSPSRSAYPNPFTRKDKLKKSAAPPQAVADQVLSQSSTDTPAAIAPPAQVKPQKTTIAANEFFNGTDPFQARLIGKDYILFYRKVIWQNQMYLQGFAVELNSFLSGLIEESFADTLIQQFSQGRIFANQELLFSFGVPTASIPGGQPLFQRSLGYPLSLLRVDLIYQQIPFSKAGRYLISLSLLTSCILVSALFFIFSSVLSQVKLALKKEDFVASVTHELKTPLTSIRLSSELLNQGWLTAPEKISEHHRLIQKESERLSRLIDNVLSLARLEKKKYTLNLTEHAPTHDAEDFAKEFEKLVTSEGFVWEQSIATNLPPLHYDTDALKQILFNLIENSLKFCKACEIKKIVFSVFEQNQTVIWQIRDFGQGVPDSELTQIFTQFYRIENELTRSTKGTGIGLSLVKTLAEQMGAKVLASNQAEGGLCISLIFSTH